MVGIKATVPYYQPNEKAQINLRTGVTELQNFLMKCQRQFFIPLPIHSSPYHCDVWVPTKMFIYLG